MRSYAFFNSVCGAICVGFILGTAFVWRMSLVEAKIENTVADVPLVERIEGNKKREMGNGNLEHKNIERLPSRVNLPVPFTSQAPEKNWDQPWQDACEEAAALMFDAYYKKYDLSPLFARDEILKMVDWENARGWQYSVEIEKVKELMEGYLMYQQKPETGNWKLGEIEIIENPTVDQIKRSVVAGHPVFVVAHGKALPNPYFRNGGPEYHALIIRGYTEDSFITNDPGTWRGENFVYKYEDLMNAVHDWNGGDVKNGKNVVLMLQQYAE